MAKRARAALGLSVHTGWAALVGVAGPPEASAIVDRRRVTMIDGGHRFVFHAAVEMTLADARRFVAKSERAALEGATKALREAVASLAAAGHSIGAAGILVGPPSSPLTLEEILASHPRLHAAEGALYRDALAAACSALGIPVTEVRAGKPLADAAARLGVPEAEVDRRLAALGRSAGRPWAKDQRDACVAAWAALG